MASAKPSARRQWIWPVLCLLAIGVAAAEQRQAKGAGEVLQRQADRAQAALDAVPMQWGPWAGEAIAAPVWPALEPDDPLARLSRVYTRRPDGLNAQVMVLYSPAGDRLAGALAAPLFAAQGWSLVGSRVIRLPQTDQVPASAAMLSQLERDEGLVRRQIAVVSLGAGDGGWVPLSPTQLPPIARGAALAIVHVVVPTDELNENALQPTSALLGLVSDAVTEALAPVQPGR